MASEHKPMYREDGWVLCRCKQCGRLNYVEPHGTTAQCRCSPEWTEHESIPYNERDVTGCAYIGKR